MKTVKKTKVKAVHKCMHWVLHRSIVRRCERPTEGLLCTRHRPKPFLRIYHPKPTRKART